MPTPFRQPLAAAKWTVRAVGDLSPVPAQIRGRVIPATVPGCIHTDLMDAGMIPDPAIGDNENAVQWVSHADWRYECTFDAGPRVFEHHEIDLVFECLDTIATIELNGDKIGQAASEFIPHRFSVLGLLKRGSNHLAVTFKSPLRHIHEEAARLGPRPVNGDWDPFVFIRKCASNFRWDWGPAVATCGIGADVRVESGRVHESPRQRTQNLTVSLDQAPDEHGSAFSLVIDGKRVFCRGVNWIPEGLWPRDRTPDRVRARLTALRDANVNMIRVWGGGRYEPDWFYDLCDELGIMVWQDFMFSCGMYPEEEPLRSLIEAEACYQVARLSRLPCVVLWCGGNECTWAYENWGWKEKLKKSAGTEQTWGRGYYLDLLPRIVAELDPSRPYWPNSPYSPSLRSQTRRGEEGAGRRAAPAQSDTINPPPNEPAIGDRHTWDVWGDGYRSVTPRFCSEFGQQSPSNWATLAEAGLLAPSSSSTHQPINSSTPSINSSTPAFSIPPLLLARQRGPGGIEGSGITPHTPMRRWYDHPMSTWFREPRSFEEWHYLAQLLQARSISIGIEWLRINQPACSGALIWQANDAWPGLSWSLIDSAGRKKLAWYAAKRSFAPRILSIHPINGHPTLFAVNDTDEAWDGAATAQRVTFSGHVMAQETAKLAVPARSASRIADLTSLLREPADSSREMIRVEAAALSADWFYLPDKHLAHEPARFKLAAKFVSDEHLSVTITAETLIRDFSIAADRVNADAACSSQLTTLLPGESTCVRIGPLARPAVGADPAAQLRRTIMYIGGTNG